METSKNVKSTKSKFSTILVMLLLIGTILSSTTLSASIVSAATTWEVWKSGSTYYATGGLSSTSFPTLWNNLQYKVVSGDTIHFAGNTDYIASSTIVLSKSNVKMIGTVGSDGETTSYLRSASSTMGVELFIVKASSVQIKNMGFSGLGYSDNKPQLRPYDLITIRSPTGFVMENCVVQYHHQYLMELSSCNDFIIRGCTFRYGQNGIATYGVNKGGVIENNLIHDCSQGPIKLRGCTGTIVRYNTIRLEYTYWRGFDHLSKPGTDGRGVIGNTMGSQGIYFGLTDSQPCFNVDVYGNKVSDASIHGTVLIKDCVDGTMRKSPGRSYGSYLPYEYSSVKSYGNKFHDNTVNGAYYSVYVVSYTSRTPQPMTVYRSNTFSNIVSSYCYLV